jgi:hypothetical protein
MTTDEGPKPLGEVEKTERGFEIVNFVDIYNNRCSLQQSSVIREADENDNFAPDPFENPGSSAVWLGITDQPSRMHLNRRQVQGLIQHLAAWLTRGTFEIDARPVEPQVAPAEGDV